MPPSLVAAPATLWLAAPDREQEIVLAGKIDRRDDVGGPRAAGDEGRAAVDQAVADLPRLVVGRRSGPDELAAKVGLQLRR